MFIYRDNRSLLIVFAGKFCIKTTLIYLSVISNKHVFVFLNVSPVVAWYLIFSMTITISFCNAIYVITHYNKNM